MPFEVKKLLYDIQNSCNLINEFTTDLNYENYCKNKLIQSAVERQFEITGEALNQLYQVDPILANKITSYRRIINFRNLLIHGYSTVSNEVVWSIIKTPQINKPRLLLIKAALLLSFF